MHAGRGDLHSAFWVSISWGNVLANSPLDKGGTNMTKGGENWSELALRKDQEQKVVWCDREYVFSPGPQHNGTGGWTWTVSPVPTVEGRWWREGTPATRGRVEKKWSGWSWALPIGELWSGRPGRPSEDTCPGHLDTVGINTEAHQHRPGKQGYQRRELYGHTQASMKPLESRVLWPSAKSFLIYFFLCRRDFSLHSGYSSAQNEQTSVPALHRDKNSDWSSMTGNTGSQTPSLKGQSPRADSTSQKLSYSVDVVTENVMSQNTRELGIQISVGGLWNKCYIWGHMVGREAFGRSLITRERERKEERERER